MAVTASENFSLPQNSYPNTHIHRYCAVLPNDKKNLLRFDCFVLSQHNIFYINIHLNDKCASTRQSTAIKFASTSFFKIHSNEWNQHLTQHFSKQYSWKNAQPQITTSKLEGCLAAIPSAWRKHNTNLQLYKLCYSVTYLQRILITRSK